MKLNWRNYSFLMVVVSGYFLLTKPIDEVLLGMLLFLGVILAVPTYFGSRKGGPTPKTSLPGDAVQRSGVAANQNRSPAKQALLRAIAEKRAEDPLIGAKLGAREIVQWLLVAMKSEKGVHIESLLAVLGALAGYSCQASVREQARLGGSSQESLVVANGTDGKKYFFGDALNKPLAEDQHSIWGLAADAAQKNGCEQLPDLGAIFKHTAESVGGVAFRIPRIPANHKPGDLPINYLTALWPKVRPTLEEFCAQPSEWPVLLGLSIQDAILKAKGVIDPRLALEIVMEYAVPMSKVDLSPDK